MAITKVMGIETEYGITVPGAPDSNPVLASSLLVNAFSGRGRKVRWDYEEESPLRDARGFEAAREPETPAEDDLGLANVILTNGARYYVDHAHPEYSSPECLDPRTLVAYDKAGERILAESARRAAELAPGGRRIQVYKNNTDGKGTSYGTHENFLVDRATPFARIVRDLTPFLVSRQVFAGAGSPVRDHHDGSVAFQIAQRSQFFEVEVGLETTLKRPIINTRDEPHADPEDHRGAQGRPPPDRVRAPVALPGRGQDLPQGPRDQPLAGRGPGALGGRAGPARGRPPQGRPDGRLGDQVPAHAADRRPRRPGVGGRQAGPGRPPVPRRPARQGPLLPPGRRRPGRAPGRRAGDHPRGHRPPRRHPGLLPRPLPGPLRPPDRRRRLGRDHLRHRPRDPPAGPHARADPGHRRPHRRRARRQPHRRGPDPQPPELSCVHRSRPGYDA